MQIQDKVQNWNQDMTREFPKVKDTTSIPR